MELGQPSYPKDIFDSSIPPMKVIILGDSGVGKTCLSRVLSNEAFDLDSRSTVGVEFVEFEKILRKKRLKIQIWDTAGQERYRSIAGAYYRKAIGVLLVYDTTSRKSFASLQKWHKEILDHAESRMFGLVFGNKGDLKNLKEVQTKEAFKWCEKHGYMHFEGSAMKKEKVADAFVRLLEEILNFLETRREDFVIPEIKLNEKNKDKIFSDSCC